MSGAPERRGKPSNGDENSGHTQEQNANDGFDQIHDSI